MANIAQLDLSAKSGELRLRALLEDMVEYHKGVYPENKLVLAVWFGKGRPGGENNLLELFNGLQKSEIVHGRYSLLWKTGANEAPFVDLHATSVAFFSQQLAQQPDTVAQFLEKPDVLYFDKSLLSPQILDAFKVITEPPGLMKGWYVSSDQFRKANTFRDLLSHYTQSKPQIGLVKIEESNDFENCRGLLNVEIDQKWLPLSEGGLRTYTFFNDMQDGNPGYFLFQGASCYQLLKFEVKKEPQHSARVLEPTHDARYTEVYLRAVHSLKQPAA